MKKSEFFYVSSPAGSGKTKNLIEYIVEHRTNKHSMIIVPTLDLISQYINNFQQLGVEVDFIDSTVEKDVKGSMIEYIGYQETTEQIEMYSITPKVLICTHKAFISSHAYFSRLEDWNIYFDEVPSLVKEHTLKAMNEEDYQLLMAELIFDDQFIIRAKHRSFAESIAEGKTEYFSRKANELREFYSDLLNHSIDLKWFYENEEKLSLVAFSVLTYRYLVPANSVTFMCANFEQSLIYKIWSEHISFKPHSIISPATLEENNKRMKIYYCQEKNYSRYLKESQIDTSFKYIDHLLREIINQYQHHNEDILIKVNNNDIGKLNKIIESLGLTDKFKIMKGDSRGLNNYMTYNVVIDISSTNPTPNMCRFLSNNYSISDEEIYFSHSYSNCYQAIFRSAIRKVGSNDIEIVVPDRRTAIQLNDQHRGSSLRGKIETICEINKRKGRPKGKSDESIPISAVQYVYRTIKNYREGKKITPKRIKRFEEYIDSYYFDDADKLNMLLIIKGD